MELIRKTVMKKYIILIGKVGSGKSRLINILASNQAAESRMSQFSVTKKCSVTPVLYEEKDKNIIHELNMIDTRGLAEVKVNNQEIIEQIKDFLKTDVHELHYVVFVMRADRATTENVGVINDLISMLKLHEFKDNSVLVITHADFWTLNKKKSFLNDLQEIDGYKELLELAGTRTVFIGSPAPEEVEKEDRKQMEDRELIAQKDLLNILLKPIDPVYRDIIKELREEKQKMLEQKIDELKSRRIICQIL